MLNISPVNFNVINFNKYQNKNKTTNLSAPKLAPLAQDTVSFTGARNLNRELFNAFENQDVCQAISKNAKPAEKLLAKQLNSALSDLVITNTNPNGIIEPLALRIKSPRSIREKIASKLEQSIIQHDRDNFISPNDPLDIKNSIQDIVGARVLVKQSSTKVNAQIIDRLIKLVEAGELKITGIELLMPPDDMEIQPYFDDMDLERLAAAVNVAKQSEPYIEVKRNITTSGYTALHLDVDLSNPKFLSRNDGYQGEIQIIGSDVAYFKEVEDLCYKIRQKKDVKSGHEAYKPFVDYFTKYLNQTAGTRAAFEEYTYRAYMAQRQKDPSSPDYNHDKLPTLEECEMQKFLPKELDYNNLAAIKDNCDKVYSIARKAGINEELREIRFYNFLLKDICDQYPQNATNQLKHLYEQQYILTSTKEDVMDRLRLIVE